MMEDHDKNLNELLTDKEFEELLVEEYEASSKETDKISQARVWNKISKQIDSKKSFSKTPFYASLAAAIFMVIFIPQQFNTLESDRIKSSDHIHIETQLSTYRKDGSTQPLPEAQFSTGDILVIQQKSSQDTYSSLIIKINQQQPTVAIESQKLNFDYQFLQKNQHIYAYQTEPGENNISFCSIHAANKTLLTKKLKTIKKNWNKLDLENCSMIKVKKP